jgi:hypothetical protein
MKFASLITAVGFGLSVQGHTIFQASSRFPLFPDTHVDELVS